MMIHIRNKLRPRQGNQFYKDRSIRNVSTLCGAPVTDRDFGPRPSRLDIEREDLCPECKRLYLITDVLRREAGRF